MKKTKKDFKEDPKGTSLDGKIQTEDQGMASDLSNKINTPKGGSPEINEIDEPKSAINTKTAAEVVTAGSDSSGIGGLRRGAITFSGSAGRTQGDESATTKETAPYKSGDRAGRRADPITRKIDLIDAEIIKTKRYQSKPLSETSERVGYNGNYYNEHVITQKNSGGAPADPMFERSIDMITLDMLYYPNGQFNIAKNSKKLSIRTWDKSEGKYANNPVEIAMGNYLTRKLTVKIANDGTINDFVFDTEDLSLPFIDEPTYRLAGDAYMRDRNLRELDRNIIISKAGNESDPSWSCLGDALVDVTDQNRLLAFNDALAGNFVGLSVRKLDEALAYQINKAAKDGSRVTGPMAEMVNGNIPIIGYGADASVDENHGRGYCFNQEAYVAGSAALWLAVNDSLPKYTTKGKLLSLPLSFKSAVATAKSNMDPLIADQLLFDELKHNELFSTIDGPYDPLKPIVMTDKCGLITPIPIDVTGSNVLYDTDNKKLNDTIYVMHYENLRNRYNINIRNFFIAGIFRWFKERGLRLYEACKDQAEHNEVTITIPVVSSATTLSLWDLIVCSSVPYIVEERLTTYTEILKYEKNFGYPYSGKVHLKDVNIDECDNYSFTSVEDQLSASTAKPIAAMKVIMPEVFWPVAVKNCEQPKSGANGKAAYTVLPHYFVQNQFSYDIDADIEDEVRKLVLTDEGATMAYPTLRSGNMFSYFDTIFGMSEEDYLLSLDRMVVYPGYQPSYNGATDCKIGGIARVGDGIDEVFDCLTYKYGMTADGTPVIPYFAYADDQENAGQTLTVKDILGTPRMMGLFQVAPAGLLTPIHKGIGLNTVSVNSAYLVLSGPGFYLHIYHGIGNDMANTILDDGSINIAANASFRNNYVVIDTTINNAGTDIGCTFRGASDMNVLNPFVSGSYSTDVGSYDPETGVYATNEEKSTLINVDSTFKYFWTRLQRLPFVINPFDWNATDLTTSRSVWTSINDRDIYDLLYTFGFAGYRASNYKELTDLRVKERIAKGMNYISDPFVGKTFLLK